MVIFQRITSSWMRNSGHFSVRNHSFFFPSFCQWVKFKTKDFMQSKQETAEAQQTKSVPLNSSVNIRDLNDSVDSSKDRTVSFEKWTRGKAPGTKPNVTSLMYNNYITTEKWFVYYKFTLKSSWSGRTNVWLLSQNGLKYLIYLFQCFIVHFSIQ